MTLRGFTGSPAGGGLSTPHIEPRPWLPAEYEFAPFHPYQMAHLVIGWPLLLPGALGGTYTQPPRRERKRWELVLNLAAETGLGMSLKATAQERASWGAGISVVRSEGARLSKSVLDVSAESGIRVLSEKASFNEVSVADVVGVIELGVEDKIKFNHLWRNMIEPGRVGDEV